ncbi:protein pal1 [Rhypophila sp. PSN 637]
MDPDEDGTLDKQWASNYILGPLYDPEPSQVFATKAARVKALPPTPPTSASPTRPAFGSYRHGRSYSYSRTPRTEQILEDPDQSFISRALSRSKSVTNKPLPPMPPGRYTGPKVSSLERKKSVHTSRPPPTSWNQGTILARANSVASSRPSTEAAAASSSTTDKGKGVRRSGSLAERYPGDRTHRPLEMLTRDHMTKDALDDNAPLRRGGSLRVKERFPGDMSHRPLAMLERDYRAADRAPHLHNHEKRPPSDLIDLLDHTGPIPEVPYHHDGPYDPTMKSRNVNKRYSPVEAVKGTNMEALKATPAEYLKDALDKHVPLQGTAVVPPGKLDMSGRKMSYQEGADLMREGDAPGGAYKRWDHIPYRDEDLKGKGEPSFSIENAQKEKMRAKEITRKKVGGGDSDVFYEMQPQPQHRSEGKDSTTRYRQRSVSNASPRAEYRSDPFSDGFAEAGPSSSASGAAGLGRSNTTGKSLAQSIKRRFGSLRRRKQTEERVY